MEVDGRSDHRHREIRHCAQRLRRGLERNAGWDPKTKEIHLPFEGGKTVLNAVNKAIAEAGHDTEMWKASDETYNQLPACCKYR